MQFVVPCGKSMRQNEVKTADEKEAMEEEVQGPLCRQSTKEERKGRKEERTTKGQPGSVAQA